MEKIRKLKNRKGFTLVELIVVLVILAILAALLIPALTGYIDKANKEKVTAECRMVVMAAQTEASEQYGKLEATVSDKAAAIATKLSADEAKAIQDLSETKGKFVAYVDEAGKIQKVVYYNDGFKCTYTATNSSYVVEDGTTSDASSVKSTAEDKPASGTESGE